MARRGRFAGIIVVAVFVAMSFGTAAVSAAPSRVNLHPILTGYERPVLITHDGRPNRVIYVVELGGRVSRATFKSGKWRKLGTFVDLAPKVHLGNDEGLLGLAFHPQFRRNGRFYALYNRNGQGDADGDLVLAELRRASRTGPALGSERILITFADATTNHNGGQLAFGPDGYLYVAVGDGGGSLNPDNNAQRLDTLRGSILRIDPQDPDGPGPRTYRVPVSNPFARTAGRDEIWAFGLRNPWRFSFDRANGDLWIGDVGERRREEVNRSTSNRRGLGAGKGKNYGWAHCEGSLEFQLDEGDADDTCSSHVLPVFEYAVERDNGKCGVVGGYVYRGPTSVGWHGLYVAGDLCGESFVLDQTGGLRLTRNSGISVSSLGEDVAGRLYAAGIAEGTIYRIQLIGPRPQD